MEPLHTKEQMNLKKEKKQSLSKIMINFSIFDHYCSSTISISYSFNITHRFTLLINIPNISGEEGRLLINIKLNFRYENFLYICEVQLT